VTQNEVIKSGDLVITSGLSDELPRGLLIGEIAALRTTGTDLFQKAYISPSVDLRNLRLLFVIK
jgi:rod shape-determining protein MreC